MNDWADVMAGRIRAREQEQQLKTKELTEKKRIKKAKAVPLWQEVQYQVAQNCEALNKKLGEANPSSRSRPKL